jgi:hypothetical protein
MGTLSTHLLKREEFPIPGNNLRLLDPRTRSGGAAGDGRSAVRRNEYHRSGGRLKCIRGCSHHNLLRDCLCFRQHSVQGNEGGGNRTIGLATGDAPYSVAVPTNSRKKHWIGSRLEQRSPLRKRKQRKERVGHCIASLTINLGNLDCPTPFQSAAFALPGFRLCPSSSDK